MTSSGQPLGPREQPAPLTTLSRYLHGGRLALLTTIALALAGLMAWRIGWQPSLAGYAFFAAAGTALAVIDYETHRLPDRLTAATLVVAGISFVTDSALSGHWHPLVRATAGAAALFAFYLTIRVAGRALFRKPAMGLGDVKLAASLGMLMAWESWSALYVGAFAGFLAGATAGLALIAAGKGKLATRIPFGPYMLIGAIIGILWGSSVGHWYLTAGQT